MTNGVKLIKFLPTLSTMFFDTEVTFNHARSWAVSVYEALVVGEGACWCAVSLFYGTAHTVRTNLLNLSLSVFMFGLLKSQNKSVRPGLLQVSFFYQIQRVLLISVEFRKLRNTLFYPPYHLTTLDWTFYPLFKFDKCPDSLLIIFCCIF